MGTAIAPCAAITLVGRGMRSLLHKLSDVWAEFGRERVHLISQSSNDLNLTFVVDEGIAEGMLPRLHALLAQSGAMPVTEAAVFGPSWRRIDQPAGARQERFRPQRGWVALAAPWAVAAAVVLVLAAVYLAIQTPPEPGVPPMAREIREWREVDPDVLDALLLERIAADPDALEALDSAYAGVAPDAGVRYAADDPVQTVYEDAQLDALIEALTPDEEAVFRELLFAYAMEG